MRRDPWAWQFAVHELGDCAACTHRVVCELVDLLAAMVDSSGNVDEVRNWLDKRLTIALGALAEPWCASGSLTATVAVSTHRNQNPQGSAHSDRRNSRSTALCVPRLRPSAQGQGFCNGRR